MNNKQRFKPAAGVGMRTVVLVEGISDQVALEALAARRGRDLQAEGTSIVPMLQCLPGQRQCPHAAIEATALDCADVVAAARAEMSVGHGLAIEAAD